MMPLRHKLLMQAQRLAGNDDTAGDLVQETMLRLWEMRQQLKAHPNIEALAMTILRNKHTDYWRRRQKEQRLEHEDIPALVATERVDSTADIDLLVSLDVVVVYALLTLHVSADVLDAVELFQLGNYRLLVLCRMAAAVNSFGPFPDRCGNPPGSV